MALVAGTRLGPYEILSPLGAGGMGEVYRARDTRLGREVAIKTLPEYVSADPEHLSRFEREARAASALNHPNVVTIHDVGRSGAIVYIAMELVEGKTVRELTTPGPLPVRKLLQIATQAAEGLARAHSGGIVHRDLKPENLMVSNDGFVKILDFGLAKVAPPPESHLSQMQTSDPSETRRGVVLGTTAYMSPEQARGRQVDYRSDQFSLGCVLYEMATGQHAFRKETAAETLAAILKEDPEPPGVVNALLPAPVCWIVERCLAKDPEDRYASTRDLARDLSALRDRLLEAPREAASGGTANLPVPRTGFVGRVRERAALAELLGRADVSIVTLTGPGGIGKSRLALEAAREMAGEFPGGVFFVPLASVEDTDAIAPAIAQALGAREATGASPMAALRERLQAVRHPMLVLLDGFEHLVSGASLVADLVEAGPEAKVLVTSRSPLHVYGEREFPVPPLAVPERPGPAGELARCDAVSLFVDRAAAVRPSFCLTPENADAVAEICRRLDGLPMAIELAAARIKLLSPAAMRDRLENRLRFLTGGARDLPERQRTLRGAIDWSHDLLTLSEQRLFRRLSVFAGGCTLEAAEAVCDARSDLGLDLLDGIGSLVDKSLLQEFEPPGGEPRFAMLETIREYGLERLAESGEESVTRRAHAAYFVVLAEDLASERAGGLGASPGLPLHSEGTAWLDRFELDHDNFRAALDGLIAAGDASWGLRLAAGLFHFWEEREHFSEGRDRLARVLALPSAAGRTRLRARALFAAGVLSGEIESSERFHAEALDICREEGDRKGVAVGLNALAVTAQKKGDLSRSRTLFTESLELWRSLDDRVAVIRALSNLAHVEKQLGSFDRARELLEECLTISGQLQDRAGMAWALNQKGDVAREEKDTAAARSLYERSLGMFREIGDRWGAAGTLADLGGLEREQGNLEAAHRLYAESLEAFRALDHKRGVARLLECFAATAAPSQPARALRLAGAAAALRQAVAGAPAPAEQARLEESLEPARSALPDAAGVSAWMEGWAMPLEEAIREAIQGRV